MYVCMCMRVCNVCMHACMHACMCVCMYACMYVCMHVCMYVWQKSQAEIKNTDHLHKILQIQAVILRHKHANSGDTATHALLNSTTMSVPANAK